MFDATQINPQKNLERVGIDDSGMKYIISGRIENSIDLFSLNGNRSITNFQTQMNTIYPKIEDGVNVFSIPIKNKLLIGEIFLHVTGIPSIDIIDFNRVTVVCSNNADTIKFSLDTNMIEYLGGKILSNNCCHTLLIPFPTSKYYSSHIYYPDSTMEILVESKLKNISLTYRQYHSDIKYDLYSRQLLIQQPRKIMSWKPTLVDFFQHKCTFESNHCIRAFIIKLTPSNILIDGQIIIQGETDRTFPVNIISNQIAQHNAAVYQPNFMVVEFALNPSDTNQPSGVENILKGDSVIFEGRTKSQLTKIELYMIQYRMIVYDKNSFYIKHGKDQIDIK